MEESSKMITDSKTRLGKVVEELQDLVVTIDNIRYVASFHSLERHRPKRKRRWMEMKSLSKLTKHWRR